LLQQASFYKAFYSFSLKSASLLHRDEREGLEIAKIKEQNALSRASSCCPHFRIPFHGEIIPFDEVYCFYHHRKKQRFPLKSGNRRASAYVGERDHARLVTSRLHAV
jgi:hypothetical protein